MDEDAAAFERIGSRKDRRKPRRKMKREEFYVKEALSTAEKFSDPELQRLFEARRIDELLSELKSGKEATVYLVEGPEGLMAAKIYADLEVRSFKNDSAYREGRFIGDDRAARAIRSRTRFGLSAQQQMWVRHEYRQLWELHEAGIPVPKPLIGPHASDIHESGRVVLMELIGDRDGPAPRLSDVRLEPDVAEDAFGQSIDIARRLHALGKAHGDLSTFNLLWWQNRVVCIDVPQMVDADENTSFGQFLRRDAATLCRSFRRLGIHRDPEEVLGMIRRS